MGTTANTTGNPGDTTQTTSSSESQTGTSETQTTNLPEGVVEEEGGEIVVINGKKFVVQDKVNALVGSARTEGKTAGKTEAEKAAERAKAQADAANLQEQGQFKTLYESEKKLREDAEAEVARITGEYEAHKTESIRSEVAAKYGIPAELSGRIQGATREDMEKDAAEVAKFVKATETKPVDTQSGHGVTNPGGGENPPVRVEDKKPKAPYAFQSKNEVAW